MELSPNGTTQVVPESAPVPAVPEEPKDQTKPELSQEVKKTDDLDSRFNALVKKEKRAQMLAHNSKREEARLNHLRAQLEYNQKEIQQFVDQGKQNPIAALQRLGWSYDDLTNFVLNNNSKTPDLQVKDVRSEVEQLRKELLERDKKQAEMQRSQAEKEHQEEVSIFKSKISSFVDSKPDAYELIKFNEAEDLVYDTVEAYFDRTKKVLSLDEACKLVEDYLEESAAKVLETKKIKSKLAPPVSEKKESNKSPTLNNQMMSSMPSQLSIRTENDRLTRALAALEK